MGHFLSIKKKKKLYIKDPQSSELGQKIVHNGILLIDEIGFENFTFRRLALKIESTEASVYRYFENKQKFLTYLLNWYWEWLDFRLSNSIINIKDPKKRMTVMLMVLIDAAKKDLEVPYVDEDILHKIVIVEGTKAYHNKFVDEQNSEGFFAAYKSVSERIAQGLLDINPKYPYPRSTASMIIENAFNTLYFSEHLPRLTDIKNDQKDQSDDLLQMLEFYVQKLLV